jgi:Xaa-Pro aminopeptidase
MSKAQLLHAEKISLQLFEMVKKNNLIVPGKTEEQLNTEINHLGASEFGIETHWHKRIVRSGINTLAPYSGNPPDRVLEEDEILFIDYGPIVNGWEADLGRTYVIGADPKKLKLKNDVEKAWHEIRDWFQNQEAVPASALFRLAVDKATEYGYRFGGDIAGHIVGAFPHEQPADPRSLELDVHPDNPNDMFLRDANGNQRHWILELQFIDDAAKTGAYFEQLLC